MNENFSGLYGTMHWFSTRDMFAPRLLRSALTRCRCSIVVNARWHQNIILYFYPLHILRLRHLLYRFVFLSLGGTMEQDVTCSKGGRSSPCDQHRGATATATAIYGVFCSVVVKNFPFKVSDWPTRGWKRRCGPNNSSCVIYEKVKEFVFLACGKSSDNLAGASVQGCCRPWQHFPRLLIKSCLELKVQEEGVGALKTPVGLRSISGQQVPSE